MSIDWFMTELSQYLTKNKIRQEDFAELVETTQATISRLANGSKSPSAQLALRIQRATDGAVPFECWFDDAADGAA